MAIEEEPETGIPEWVVTFGDMMSLLLTFFIMLVSLSEIKSQEKYQALVESIRRSFGHDTSNTSMAPGDHKPRNSELQKLASQGRAKRKDTMRGGAKVKAPVGENREVRIVREGNRSTVGGMFFFEEGSVQLSEENKNQLALLTGRMIGKAQKIEIRGHTGLRPSPAGDEFKNNWDLSYARCRATQAYLLELNILPKRIRLGVAAQFEPFTLKLDTKEQRKNPRVEVFMLDEIVTDRSGAGQKMGTPGSGK